MAPAEKPFSYSNLLKSSEGQEVPTVVGLILFANDKRLAVVGVNKQHDLVTGFVQAPKQFDPNEVDRKSGRILCLPNYDKVQVVKADVGAIELGTFRSIRQPERAVYAKFYYTDPNSGAPDNVLVLEEERLLRLMVGEQGGVAVFHGGGLPEENVIVIEEPQVQGNPQALVAFLHPSDGEWGLDSVAGTYEFFHRLNGEFLSKTPQPLQDKVVKTLEITVRRGEIADTNERLELLKAQLIAHARLAVKDPWHQRFLAEHLPEPTSSFIESLRRAFGRPSQKTSSPTVREIDTIFLGRGSTQEPAPRKVSPPDNPLGLRTSKIRKLYKLYHGELRGRFGLFDDDYEIKLMDKYFLKIMELIVNPATQNGLKDIDLLLNELENSNYGKSRYIDLSDPNFGLMVSVHCVELGIMGILHYENVSWLISDYLRYIVHDKLSQITAGSLDKKFNSND